MAAQQPSGEGFPETIAPGSTDPDLSPPPSCELLRCLLHQPWVNQYQAFSTGTVTYWFFSLSKSFIVHC
jgi:hypothetical protein